MSRIVDWHKYRPSLKKKDQENRGREKENMKKKKTKTKRKRKADFPDRHKPVGKQRALVKP